jgi:nitroreductase
VGVAIAPQPASSADFRRFLSVRSLPPSMEFDDVIRTRRSVHQYSDADIDDETLYDLFEDVRHAPSSFNLQPWEFLVVRGDDLERLQSVAYGQEHVTDAAAAVVVLGTLDPSDHAERVTSDLLEKGYLPNEGAADARLDTVDSLADADAETRRVWTTQSDDAHARRVGARHRLLSDGWLRRRGAPRRVRRAR